MRSFAGSGPNTVHAITRNADGSILHVTQISVTWNHYHLFKVGWSPTQVTFYVDGVVRATHSVAIPGSSPKPIGLWNDRSAALLVNRVLVSP